MISRTFDTYLTTVCFRLSPNRLQLHSESLESLKSIQIYENGDEAFDALVIDQDRHQIIVGAK